MLTALVDLDVRRQAVALFVEQSPHQDPIRSPARQRPHAQPADGHTLEPEAAHPSDSTLFERLPWTAMVDRTPEELAERAKGRFRG